MEKDIRATSQSPFAVAARVEPRRQVRKKYEPAALESRLALGKDVTRKLRLLRFVLDSAVIVAAHVLAWVLRFRVFGSGRILADAYVMASVISVVVFVALIGANRLFDEDTIFPESGEFARLGKAAAQTAILFPALAFFTHTQDIARTWVAMAIGFSVVGLSTERLLMRALVQRRRKAGNLRRPVIVISHDGAVGDDTVSSEEFEVVGGYSVAKGLAFLEGLAASTEADSKDHGALSVIIEGSHFDEDTVWRIMLAAGQAGCQVYLESPIRSVARDRLTVRPFRGKTVVRVTPPALSGYQAARKRAFDVIASALGLLVLSPILLGISLLVLITSGRPIFYGQERVGRDGKTFRIWKFRSMKNNAESQTGAVWAQADDPRRTPLGRILRATSIDELPQIWNVLRGDMSLVGPRPERPSFVEEFVTTIPWYPYRHRMRPGITGWAQAHGLRGNTPLEDRIAYDNYYIEHWSLALDIKILVLTAREVVKGEHAY